MYYIQGKIQKKVIQYSRFLIFGNKVFAKPYKLKSWLKLFYQRVSNLWHSLWNHKRILICKFGVFDKSECEKLIET